MLILVHLHELATLGEALEHGTVAVGTATAVLTTAAAHVLTTVLTHVLTTVLTIALSGFTVVSLWRHFYLWLRKKSRASIEMEPNWMKSISNESVCGFFYGWFIVYAVFFSLALLLVIGTFLTAKKLGAAGIAMGLQSVLTMLIAGSFMMFHYMVCDRALLGANAPTKE